MKIRKDQILNFWSWDIDKTLKYFKSSEKGLSDKEANSRLFQYGPNEIEKKEKRHGLQIFLSQFKNVLVLVLIIAAVIAFFLHERIDSVVILAIVVLNSIMGFIQEYKAEKALRELKSFISKKSRVLRNSEISEVDTKSVVPGDIVLLSIGDVIPADIRLIESYNLSTDESPLTGESLPVNKETRPINVDSPQPQNLTNIAFMGTSVASGSARGIVIATAMNTFFGKTAAYLEKTVHEGDLHRNIKKFSNLLLKVIVVMTAFIFAANALLAKGLLGSLLFALALAVGITPEVLPVIMTIVLSRGALRLARQKVITKRLASIEDLGNMDTLCCDKTGTLTEGEISLSSYVDLDGNEDNSLVLAGMLCNSVSFERGKSSTGNPIDVAIWKSETASRMLLEIRGYTVLYRNDFDFTRRRMSVIAKHKAGNIMIAKGAPESILSVCRSAIITGKTVDLSPDLVSQISQKVSGFENKGYRVIALAKRLFQAGEENIKEEKDLTLTGFLLFLDPPKSTIKKSLAALKRLGVVVKILSGDSPIITRKICIEVGLDISEDVVVTGDELSSLNEPDFKEYSRRFNVFSRISPEQKLRIVESIKRSEHVVGFLGDGINDAPALKAADVGISVDTATGIAKETADIILLRKSLRVLAQGIVEGRKTFGNITKYILNTISANYGNMFTLAASSFFLKFIPLLPSQILLNNFISDFPLLTISTDNVDEEFLKKPRRWNIKLISRFMTYFGLISTFFDMALILSLILILKVGTDLFRTAWFVLSVLSELVVTFSIRTRLSFFKSKPSGWLLITSILTGSFAIGITFMMLGSSLFKFVRMPGSLLILIGAILVLYFLTVEVAKRYFFKKFEP